MYKKGQVLIKRLSSRNSINKNVEKSIIDDFNFEKIDTQPIVVERIKPETIQKGKFARSLSFNLIKKLISCRNSRD